MSTHFEPRDPYLTIVPDDAFVENDALDTIVDVTQEEPRTVAPLDLDASMEPAPERETTPKVAAAPAPERRRGSKLLVAGALGGGMVVGGGVVGAIGLLAMLVVGVVGAGAGTALWLSQPVAPAVVEVPVAMPVDGTAPVDGEETEAAAAAVAGVDEEEPEPVEEVRQAPATAAPERPTPAPAPVDEPMALPPAAPAVSADQIPADEVLVKLLSDPPAANVFVDGQLIGRTPLKAFLSPETHQVVVASGKASGEFSIDPSGSDRICFKAKGRKVQQEACR